MTASSASSSSYREFVSAIAISSERNASWIESGESPPRRSARQSATSTLTCGGHFESVIDDHDESHCHGHCGPETSTWRRTWSEIESESASQSAPASRWAKRGTSWSPASESESGSGSANESAIRRPSFGHCPPLRERRKLHPRVSGIASHPAS